MANSTQIYTYRNYTFEELIDMILNLGIRIEELQCEVEASYDQGFADGEAHGEREV